VCASLCLNNLQGNLFSDYFITRYFLLSKIKKDKDKVQAMKTQPLELVLVLITAGRGTN
jgi:hypothetical protein